MARKKTFMDEIIDAAEQVGRVALKGAAISAKTTFKVTRVVVKETAKGIKNISKKIKDRSERS